MSVRIIARRDLYRLQQEVEMLERELESIPNEKREELENHLRKVRAERDRMRKVLDGSKEPAVYRKPL